MKALVTGAASGIGRAIAARLRAAGYEVTALDVDELDVSDPHAWSRVAAGLDGLDVACLNAGVETGTGSIAEVTDEQYRRILDVNVGGVVHGVRALLPLLEGGGRIVVTASLAGLTAMPSDPLYTGTKHFLIGFVRSVAPQLAERGISINAVCPGMTDTPLIAASRPALEAAGFPLLSPGDVASAVLKILGGDGTGEAWFVQPGRAPEPYAFRGVPGPRVPGAEGLRPPLSAG